MFQDGETAAGEGGFSEFRGTIYLFHHSPTRIFHELIWTVLPGAGREFM